MFTKFVSLVMASVVCVSLIGCTGVPDKVAPVEGFELSRYLGKWYEIARFDHSFEEGLSEVTATYSMRDDGGV
ncbi:MAG: lipocalin family protein, partial [Pseudomonadota bacterium]|nr:lipocalin family protein [Pseudomonadota bacterium]